MFLIDSISDHQSSYMPQSVALLPAEAAPSLAPVLAPSPCNVAGLQPDCRCNCLNAGEEAALRCRWQPLLGFVMVVDAYAVATAIVASALGQQLI